MQVTAKQCRPTRSLHCKSHRPHHPELLPCSCKPVCPDVSRQQALCSLPLPSKLSPLPNTSRLPHPLALCSRTDSLPCAGAVPCQCSCRELPPTRQARGCPPRFPAGSSLSFPCQNTTICSPDHTYQQPRPQLKPAVPLPEVPYLVTVHHTCRLLPVCCRPSRQQYDSRRTSVVLPNAADSFATHLPAGSSISLSVCSST